MLIDESPDPKYREIARRLLEKKEYSRLHLLNSYLILERCDSQKPSVQIAKKILFAYVNEEEQDEKIKYIFRLFKNIRTVSYIAYDLQVSNTPLTFEISDEKSKSKKCEFDGLVIFPNRREKQLLFLEAKNREKKPERGRRDLINRINEIGRNEKSGVKLEDEDQVIRVNMDAYFEYTINL